MKAFLTLSLLLGTMSVFAAKPASAPESFPVEGEYSWMADDAFKQQKTEARARADRNLASGGEVNDQLLSPEFKKARARFLAVTSGQDLKALIIELDANYSKHPDDLKLMTAMVTPLLKFKAFTYKIYPYLSKEEITHSMLLSGVQNFSSFMNMNLPTAQWKAGFELVTSPGDESDLKRFNSASDLQSFLVREVYPAYLTAAKRVQALNLNKKPVVWDNKLIYGTGSFSDNLARFQLIGEGERYTILAGIHYTLADLCKFSSYNIERLLPVVTQISKLYGYDSVFSSVDGVNAKKIAAVFKKNENASLFTLSKFGGANMRSAFKHLKEGSRNLNLSWLEFKNRNDSSQTFIRSALFLPYSQIIDDQVEALEGVLNGRATIRSDVTGEVLTVDLPAFYANPPQDLKALLPTSFDNSPNMKNYSVKMNNGTTKAVEFRNYSSGSANGWNAAAYQTLLPEVTKGTDIPHAMRIMNQSASGAMSGVIIQPFMLH